MLKNLKSFFNSLNTSLKLFFISAVIAIPHFLFFVLSTDRVEFARKWNTGSCALSKLPALVDQNCRYEYTLGTIQWQAIRDANSPEIACLIKKKDPLAAEVLPRMEDYRKACAQNALPIWGDPSTKIFDIGWDAYSIWYGRAAMLHFKFPEDRNVFSLLGKSLDPVFVRSLHNVEHFHYPTLLPSLYAWVLNIFRSPNPVPLQVLQIGVYLFAAFLFYRTRPLKHGWVWMAFAFLPIAGQFFFRLYADIWIISGLLSLMVFLEGRRYIAAALLAFFIVFLKTEAWVQTFAFMLCYTLVYFRGHSLKAVVSTKLLYPWAALLLATGIYLSYIQAPLKDSDFYLSLGERLQDPIGSLKLMARILAYYADVFFRPKLWGLLWVAGLYWVFKNVRSLYYTPWILVGLILVIPYAFLSFPFGHKEVVLTGSNRALWQLTPLLWLLVRHPLRRAPDSLHPSSDAQGAS